MGYRREIGQWQSVVFGLSVCSLNLQVASECRNLSGEFSRTISRI